MFFKNTKKKEEAEALDSQVVYQERWYFIESWGAVLIFYECVHNS